MILFIGQQTILAKQVMIMSRSPRDGDYVVNSGKEMATEPDICFLATAVGIYIFLQTN